MVGAVPLFVRDLKKNFQKNAGEMFQAVKGISFEVSPGECFGLLGPNGAGKSTTINCLTGYYPSTTGEVLIHGYDVYRDPKRARQHLGVCTQEDTLDTDFKVMEQMIRHASFFRIPRKLAEEKSRELLRKFNLTNEAKDKVESLSGGMRRRLQVARALVSSPKVLVLDEPTTGLDPDARRILWDILVELRQQGMAILLTTHYMDEAERLCDRIALLHHGKILDVDTPAGLIKKYIKETVIEEEIRPGVKWKRVPNLEDVFLRLTGNAIGKGTAL